MFEEIKTTYDRNIALLSSGKEKRRYTVERAIVEAKGSDKERFLVLDDGVPATAINKHLLIKQESQAHPSSTPAYNLCLFLNAMDEVGIEFTDVAMDSIHTYICDVYVEEGKTYQSIRAYIYDIANLYESLAVRSYPLDRSLYRPVSDEASGPRVKRSRRNDPLTMIGKLQNEFLPKKTDDVRISYTKWYSTDEIEAISAELTLLYRCIFFDTIFTGHRIDSALSITLDTVNMKEREVNPTRTKTGRKHISMMPPVLSEMMQSYLIEVRRKIVDSTGSPSNYFFLGRDGLPVTYAAYNAALKTAGEKASSKNSSLSIENLRTHAGRSTFAAVIRSYQLEQRRQGKTTLTDSDFCNLMDWKSLANLENFDITTRAQEVSPLLKDYYAQYMDFADMNR